MRKTVLPLLLLPPLTACGLFGSEPRVVNPAPPGVSYRVMNGNVAATDQRAQDYCGRYGKQAKHAKASNASDSEIVEYSCS
jgi:hypothetical protein